MSRSPNIVCAGFWHDDNRGDAAIAEASVNLLQEAHPDARISVVSLLRHDRAALEHATRHLRSRCDVDVLPSPLTDELTARSAGTSPVHRLASALRWFVAIAPAAARVAANRPAPNAAIPEADLLIHLGGSDVYDDPDVRLPFSLARLITVLFPAWCARRSNVPVVLLGHTLGPFDRRTGRAMLRRLLSKDAIVAVRERRSRTTAKSIGLYAPMVIPDLAFAIEPRDTAAVASQCESFTGTVLGLVVRQHPHRGRTGDDAIVEELARLARSLIDAGAIDRVAVVVQATGPTPIEDDRSLSAQLMAALPSGRASLVDADLSSSELAAVYGRCAAVVTVRLHAAILAMTAGTPSLAITYFSDKTAGVMDGVTHGGAWCEYDDVDADSLIPMVKGLLATDRSSVLSEVAAAAAALRAVIASLPVRGPGPERTAVSAC